MTERNCIPEFYDVGFPEEAYVPDAPTDFSVRRVSSKKIEVSWRSRWAAESFEIEAKAYNFEKVDENGLPVEERVCHRVLPGVDRSYVFTTLRSSRVHLIYLRALIGTLSSEWIATKARTSPLLAPGYPRPPRDQSFLVPSEKNVKRAQSAPRNITGQMPDVPLGLTGEETTVRELLRARKYRTGKDFYMSSAVGRPKSQQDERIRRMRMVVTHMDMYGTHYMNDNRWSMGPFYTEERGRRNLHRLL